MMIQPCLPYDFSFYELYLSMFAPSLPPSNSQSFLKHFQAPGRTQLNLRPLPTNISSAKSEGRKLQDRITGPSLRVGGSLFFGSLIAAFVAWGLRVTSPATVDHFDTAGLLSGAGFVLATVGAFTVLLGILPTEQKLLAQVVATHIFFSFSYALLMVVPECVWVAKLVDRLPAGSNQEKWYFDCYVAGLGLNGLGFLVDGSILVRELIVHTVTTRPRALLNLEWRVLGLTLLRQSMLALVDTAMWSTAGVDRIIPTTVLAVRVLFIFTSGLLGVLLCLPDFRTSAQVTVCLWPLTRHALH